MVGEGVRVGSKVLFKRILVLAVAYERVILWLINPVFYMTIGNRILNIISSCMAYGTVI